ncbi:DUF5133 domain-containing protein [Streptomyces sp. NRRL F-2664]|uniref:DUF5133 domain-containing protein n=1 Tax=Streptomyces sp. NRRL F-2664 TaxID=1463842 RepID=UPI002D21BAAB|nr:DUF5133 domain-containing protein [Streptomyces sp. NRRL F-2664]
MIQRPAAHRRTQGGAPVTDGCAGGGADADTTDMDLAVTGAAATDPDADGALVRAALNRATGMVMALVPCTAERARRLLADAARAAGVTLPRMARTVIATRACPADVDPDCERALRAEIGHARSPQPPSPPAPGTVLPAPDVLRRHLDHLRAVRRRTLAAPDDPALRAALEDAAYTLCVLMGQRHAHGALLAAEERVAAHRLPPAPPLSPPEPPTLPPAPPVSASTAPASVPGGVA